ncbi:hypothetical protein ACXYV5_24090, partial [Escherichia coli]
WVHVQLHQQKGMISLSPPTICNSAVMDTFQRSMGKSKPVRDTQLEGEKPQSKESANSTENPGYEEFY